jgi:hypothetical protein
MKSEFKMSKIDIQIAIVEYFEKRGITIEPKQVNLKGSPQYDFRGEPVLSTYDISATVEVSHTFFQRY